jgi:pimeloyl-ACP methyl ester carboxylesterase
VSGVVFEPVAPAAGPRPILAWAHGTFGLGDQCAPSRRFFSGSGAAVPLVKAAVQQDLVFAETDYRGLGTPGPHPYLVNQTAGRDVLDSIRAAAHITGQQEHPEGLVLGQSQGGGAALLAAELAPSYAPDVQLRAAVGVSVPSDLGRLDAQLSGGPYVGYVLMTIEGYESAYPKLARDSVKLTAKGQAALKQIAGQCSDQILDAFAGHSEKEYGASQVLHSSDFRAELADNEPGQVGTRVPIFLVHGVADDTIPVQDSRDLLARYCADGSPVTAKIYPGAGHIDVLGKALADIVNYLRNRLAGTPPASSCPAG